MINKTDCVVDASGECSFTVLAQCDGVGEGLLPGLRVDGDVVAALGDL